MPAEQSWDFNILWDQPGQSQNNKLRLRNTKDAVLDFIFRGYIPFLMVFLLEEILCEVSLNLTNPIGKSILVLFTAFDWFSLTFSRSTDET